MSSAVPKEKGMREYRKTGLFTLKRALIDLGSRAIDGRSSVGVALRRWKADLAQDLSGDDFDIDTARDVNRAGGAVKDHARFN